MLPLTSESTFFERRFTAPKGSGLYGVVVLVVDFLIDPLDPVDGVDGCFFKGRAGLDPVDGVDGVDG